MLNPNKKIVFFQPDDPRAADSLANAMRIFRETPSIGLIIKVDEHDNIVNWTVTNPDVIIAITALSGE